jgi:hypothetical protein
MTSPRFDTREAWLNFVAAELSRTVFAAAGVTVPAKVRLAVAFPSTGNKGKRIGECWDASASADQHFEIMIRPDIAEPMEAAAILAHELVHAAAGLAAGHGPAFRKVALAIGLEGKMKSTVAGPRFLEAVAPILTEAGAMPHARLDWSGLSNKPKKQKARLVKCECSECGYIVRTAAKWIAEVGPPLCPQHGPMVADMPEDGDPIEEDEGAG